MDALPEISQTYYLNGAQVLALEGTLLSLLSATSDLSQQGVILQLLQWLVNNPGYLGGQDSNANGWSWGFGIGYGQMPAAWIDASFQTNPVYRICIPCAINQFLSMF